MRRIVWATDGSDSAADAAAFLHAAALPEGTEVRVVAVLEPMVESVLESMAPEYREKIGHVVEAAAAGLRREGLTVTGEVRSGNPAHEIILAAEESAADLIVVGSRGLTGLAEFVLGSVARNVARHAECSVLVARPLHVGLREVVLALDGSEHGQRALELLCEAPLPTESHISVVGVVRPMTPIGLAGFDDPSLFVAMEETNRELKETAGKLLDDAAARLAAAGHKATACLREGDPAWEILTVARDSGADLIVAGARGVSTIQGLLTGSVADRLLKKADRSVLLVR